MHSYRHATPDVTVHSYATEQFSTGTKTQDQNSASTFEHLDSDEHFAAHVEQPVRLRAPHLAEAALTKLVSAAVKYSSTSQQPNTTGI